MLRRILGMLYVPPAAVLTLASAAFVTLLIGPWVVLPRGRRERYAIHGARVFAWLCRRPILWLREEVVGAEHVRRPGDGGPGQLVICNHRSWLDPALVIFHTWSQGISKAEVKYVPFFGLNGYLSGGIFFDRADPVARARVPEEAVTLLKAGANVHLYPEGTRSRDGKLREKVHLKLLAVAWEHGIDVLPACVWGTEGAVPVRGLAAYPGARVGIEIGAPLRREDFPDGASYAAASWEAVRAIAVRRGVA
jgi:1-acyl-sn-glycerol-3-phosphate acyltransferase